MKNISLKWLGMIGMIGAPGLWIESSFYDSLHHQNTSIGGVFDLLYMLGWICSIIGLLRLKAAGKKRVGAFILYTQIVLLAVANIWNVWEIIDPTSNHPLYRLLDMFWPISNMFMLVTGTAVVFGKTLHGYQRFVPLAVGLWIVVTGAAFTFIHNDHVGFYIMNIYSTLAWFLLGFIVYQSRSRGIVSKRTPSHQMPAYTPASFLIDEAF